jgi:uncharacterized protein
MDRMRFFFDTYAIIEMIKGSPSYSAYSDQVMITSFLNALEVFYVILREFNDETKAKSIYYGLKGSLVGVSDEIVLEALKFKFKHRKEGLSYTDCIGYIYAKKNDLIFVTGDSDFKNFDGVEFVR